jgi:hypothetical protein
MTTELLLQALGVVAGFIALIYSGSKNSRESETHNHEMLKKEIELLKLLKEDPDNHHYRNIMISASKRTDSIFRRFLPYKPVYFRMGLLIYVGFALTGALLFVIENFWEAAACLVVSLIGFEAQKRSLYPGMMKEPPSLQINDKKD